MPGPTVKELLMKWGIDNSNWKKAIGELASMLNKANQDSAKAQASAAAKLDAQKAKLKEIVAAQKSETAEIEKQIDKLKIKAATSAAAKADAQARLAAEKAASAEATKQTSLQKNLQQIQRTLQQEVYTKLANEKLLTAEINKQTAALRLQAAQQRTNTAQRGGPTRGGGGGGGRGGFGGGGFLGGLAGLAGGGMAGSLFAAVAAGEAFDDVLSSLVLKMAKFIESTGPLQQVREQFEKLAITSGRNPTQFIDALRKATSGLVDDMSLYRNANTFMQSGIHASQEEIVKLTQATVGLARAQGRDAASAVDSLNRFFLTGRAFTLAYATGIQRTQLQVRELGGSTDSATRATLAFRQALEAITAQYAAIGQPTLTLTDRLKQLQVANERFLQQLTIGLSQSQGFQNFLTWIGQIADHLNQMGTSAASWGSSLGVIFDTLTEAGKTASEALSTIAAILKSMGGLFKVFLPESVPNDFIDRLTTVKGIFTTMSQSLVFLKAVIKDIGIIGSYAFDRLANDAKNALNPLKGFSKKAFEEEKAAAEKMNQQLVDNHADMLNQMAELQEDHTDQNRYRIQYAAPSNVFTEEQQQDASKKIAKAQEQIAVESAKLQLEQTQQRIKIEEELTQAQYSQGLITIQQYLSKKQALEEQDHQARLTQMRQDHDARMQYLNIEQSQSRELAELKKAQADQDAQTQLASIERQKTEISLRLQEDVRSGKLTPGEAQQYGTDVSKQAEVQKSLALSSRDAAKRQASAELAEQDANRLVEQKKYLAQVQAENVRYQQEGKALTQQGLQDELTARQKLSDEIQKLDKDKVERAKEAAESEFQQGEISASEYLDKRVEFIEQEYKAVQDGAQRKLEANKNSDTAIAEFEQKMAEAAAEREKELTKLSLSETDIRTKALESSYDRAQRLLQSQLTYQQSISKGTEFGGGNEEQRSIIEAQISLLKSRLEQEVKSLQMIKEGTDQWLQQQEKIEATKDALVKYNEELAKTDNLSQGISSALKELAAAAGKFPKIGAQRVSAGLGTLAGGLEEQAATRQRIAQRAAAAQARAQGKEALPVTPDQIFKSLQKVSQEAGEDLGKHLESASASVEQWRQKMAESGNQMDSSIQKTTKALQDLTAQIEKTIGVMGGESGKGGGVTGPSGPRTASHPGGTVTQSDLMQTEPFSTNQTTAEGSGPQQAASQLSVALSATADATMGLKKGFTDLISNSLGNNGLVGYFKNLGKNTQAASDDLSNFADSVSSIAGNIGGMMSAVKGTGGPFQAMMQGMSSGGGLGGQLGSMFGPMGAMIGQGVGMGVGAVVGVFSGKAEREAEKIAKEITAKFNAVLTEVQQGTLGLGNAVTQEIQIIQQAVDQLSGKKGGRQQLQSMLPQMEQQLLQLQEQQQQVIKSFDATVEQISAPEASQALVQPIQAIIQTYQQYVLAGGNVQIANQYLQDSFKNLVSQGLDTLNQAEQNAVQNALNYNNLLIERQQLIQDTNQQIQDVMSQGVAVRQMPEGVTKAQQLEQIELNSQTQMDNLNQQIAVSQHQLSNEQKIFNLAVTRVGLETQLVQLQDAQLDKQDASTEALLQEVEAFSGATPTNLPTALSMIGLGGTYINPSQEPGLAPVPPVPTGIAAIDQQNELEYQQALAYYEQQQNLSSTATIGSTAGSIPGGAQGVTVAGTPSSVSTATTQQLGSALDAMASNIAAWPAAMQDMFADPSTTVNVGGPLLEGIAQVFGVTPTGAVTMPPASGSPISSPIMPVSKTIGTPVPVNFSNPIFETAMAGTTQQTNDLVSSAVQRQTIEENISTLSASRVNNELQLVQMKMAEIQADMTRIQAWSDLLNSPAKPGTQAQTLEDMLQSVYLTRSRQGFGGFNGEVTSAVAL